MTEQVGITLKYEVLKSGNKIHGAFNFYNSNGANMFDAHESNTDLYHLKKEKGIYTTTVWVYENLFSEGIVIVGVALVTHDPFIVHFHDREAIAFNMVEDIETSPTRGDYAGNLPGIIRPQFEWKSEKL